MKTNMQVSCTDQMLTKQVFETLAERIGPQKFNAWFKHGTDLVVEQDFVKVAVPNPFVANWVEQHYQAEIADIVTNLTGRSLPVMISIDPDLSGQCSKRDLDNQAKIVSCVTQGRSRNRKPILGQTLKHNLKDFVVGTSNQLAYQAALSISSGSDKNFSQLFVHGPCGVGKTHLLQGICSAASGKLTPSGRPIRWKYVTGEQFTNEFITALRNKQGGQFRERYRNLDLLAIDDVHFLAAKRATQDEFLHTFNAIEAAGKQIIMASDTHPRLVGDLNDQLISRFMSGMVVKVDAPDTETRRSIIHRKASQLNVDLPDNVTEYIVRHIRGSVRELEGTMVKLSAIASLGNENITLELTRHALADHLARTDSATTLGDIEAVVATFFGITPADIHSSRRTKTVSVARMIAMFLARKRTSMSFPEIGRFMGKNHSSVVLAVQKLQKILAKDDDLVWTTPMGTKSMSADELVNMLDEQIG